MKALLQASLFLLTFTIEVHVKAKSKAHNQTVSQIVTQPENCLQGRSICALRANRTSYFLALNPAAEVVLDQQTTIIRLEQNKIRFLEGLIWVKAKEMISIQTEYGSIEGVGDLWISRGQDEVFVEVASGRATLHPRGSKELLSLLPGQKNWLSKLGENYIASSGIPQLMDFKFHIQRWYRLYSGNKAAFRKEAKVFYDSWQKAVEIISRYQQNLAERMIAQDAAAKERDRIRREKIRQQEIELKKMFRAKVFDDPSSI